MSVAERARLFEGQRSRSGQDGRPNAAIQISPVRSAEEQTPQLPPRPNEKEVDLIIFEDDVPQLPPRPGGQSRSPNRPQPPKIRPQVPPKSKSLSALPVIDRASRRDEHRILLVDLEEENHDLGSLQILDPLPSDDDEDGPSILEQGNLLVSVDHSNRSDGKRSPSPLKLPIRQDLFRSISDNAQQAFKPAPKTFETIARGAQQTFKAVKIETPKVAQRSFTTVKTEAPKVARSATDLARKAVHEVQTDFSKAINHVPRSQVGDDISDLAKRLGDKSSICTRCASLPLSSCFIEQGSDAPAYVSWSTPLLRVIFHHRWCRMCQLLLSALFLPEHDPLLDPEIQDHIQPEWLRGVPLRKWVNEGHIDQEQNWPFGRSEHPDEGPTNILGSFASTLGTAANQFSHIGMRVLTRAAFRGRVEVLPSDLRRPRNTHTYSQGYKKGLRAGKEFRSKHRGAAVIMITISTQKSDTPGLLWVDLIAASNAPASEQQVRSHFMLRAVQNGFSITTSPKGSISYGFVLDPNWINMSIGKLWLAECENRHGDRCDQPAWASAMEKPDFLRLIDIQNLKLIRTDRPESCRYACLSYTWGNVQTLKLRLANVNELSSHRGLEKYLPRIPLTILHAMQVVKDVGLRYLWVDALCILQEKNEESRQQIASMDSVYGSALFTIVAADGLTADSGLHGIRAPDFSPRYEERQISQQIAKVNEEISVIAPSSAQQDLRSSEWNTRAWTFQERLLSRRLLIFSKNQVVFHCRGMIGKEDMPLEDSGMRHLPLEWLDLKPKYLGLGVDSHWKDGSLEMTRHGATHVVRSGTFAEYAKMIRQYTTRRLSFESDALNALAGLLRIFSICFQSECIWGLPANLLDVALIWRPIEPLRRRPPRLGFPSWSWVGWEGKIAYDAPVTIQRDDYGQKMAIEGFRSILRYYVFDERTGTLLPLNGTSRGLPLDDVEVPYGWEAHHDLSTGHTSPHPRRPADLFDLDARIIPELSDKHLVFWTTATSDFTLEPMPPQRVDAGWGTKDKVERKAIMDSGAQFVGNLLLDGRGPDQIQTGLHEFILLSEAYCSLEDVDPPHDDYPYYLIMMVVIDSQAGISYRLGLGRVRKVAWIAAEPTTKMICLG